MYKLTLINVVGSFVLAVVLASTPMGASLASPATTVLSAGAVNIAPLMGMTPAQLATLYPALDQHELDKLVFRIADQLSMAGVP